MEIKEIVEQLKYYTEDLPKEALKEAIKHKEEITPKLLEMLEYTKNNLEKIYYEEDEFFGYIYAIFLLAEFKETKAFPYLIDLINRDEDIVDYIIGDDYPEYLPRLLASTYNGDDKALFDIIENNALNEFVRSSVLQTFAILYLNGIKDRDFIVSYFKKLLDDKKEEDNSYLYQEIFVETEHLRLIELDGIIDKVFYLIDTKEEIQDLKDTFANENYKINRNIYPFKPFYEYIYDTIGIMEEWQCFRYREDEEYEQSNDNKVCEYIISNRANNIENNHNLGRNDLCYCGSGKKYKKCCMNKNKSKDIEKLDFIDHCISKAEWYLKRKEAKKGQALYRMAWFDVKDICKENNIKSIIEYDEKYEGYDSLLNWLQDYDNILEMCDEEDKLYERLELWNSVEEIFDLNNEKNLYWKERTIREKANTEFRLGNEEKALKMIEDYLKIKPEWVWGYVEMADWYDNKRDAEHYNLEKAKFYFITCEEDMNQQYEYCVTRIIPFYQKQNLELEEIAILVGNKYEAQEMAMYCLQNNIPYYISKHNFERTDTVKWIEKIASWINDKTKESFEEIAEFYERLLLSQSERNFFSETEVLEKRKKLYNVLIESIKKKNNLKEWIESNEDMYKDIVNNPNKYDVLVPSDYMIDRLIKENRLEKINKSNITNLSNVSNEYLNPEYDKENDYVVPYMTGTLGILYNKKIVKEEVDSWNILWSEKYKGQIWMWDSLRDVIGVALKRSGFSMNSTSDSELNQAKQSLIVQNKLLKGYAEEESRDAMIANEGALALVYSGEAKFAIDQNPNLDYVIPKEGSNKFVDGFVIVKNTKHKDAAEKFINFMCRSNIAIRNMTSTGYTSPIKGAWDEFGNNKIMFPSKEELSRCEAFLYDANSTEKYNKMWKEVR